MAKKILIADPDYDQIIRTADIFRRHGYQTCHTTEADRIMGMVRDQLPTVVVMEVMFPGLSGFAVLKSLQLNPSTTHLPVIMTSHQSDDLDRILGLEIGAADYLTKPVHLRELLLRVEKIVARHRHPTSDGRVTLGELFLDRERCEATIKGHRVDFTVLEFKLLYLLAERCGRVQTRENILKDVWGYDAEINSRTLDTHIRKIRAKLGDFSDYVETSYGLGYRAVEPDRIC